MNQHRPLRRLASHPVQCHQMFKSRRTAGVLMAGPFVFCFALFGIFNLIGGTVLTLMACKPKFSPRTMMLIERLLRNYNERLEPFLDPLKVVGSILLLTGSMLVIVGIMLGVIACRSVNIPTRRRGSCASFSGIQMSSINGPTSFAGLPTGSSTNRFRSMSLIPAADRKKSVVGQPSIIHKEEDAEMNGADDTSLQNENPVDAKEEQENDNVALERKTSPVAWSKDDKLSRRSSVSDTDTEEKVGLETLSNGGNSSLATTSSLEDCDGKYQFAITVSL